MRPHIDFIQAQNLPWEDAGPEGWPGARLKCLSRDADTGALSAILHLPEGSQGGAVRLSRDLECLVLDGAMTVGDTPYPAYAYAFFPAGHDLPAVTAPGGATLLAFTGAADPDGADDPDRRAARLVEALDISDGRWDGDFDRFNLGPMKDGARMRVLREDPETGETTYVTATMAFRRGSRAERHPISQEFFLLSGELAGNYGIMQAGAYCIRPPMAKHAPYGSPSGALIFFRGLGGPQTTEWEDAEPFTFSPRHRPILPDELKPYGAPAPRVSRY